MKVKEISREIPEQHLIMAAEGLQELARRLEYDAAGYARLDTPEAKRMAEKCLDEAKKVRESSDFYLNL